jgi:hypothetical protein
MEEGEEEEPEELMGTRRKGQEAPLLAGRPQIPRWGDESRLCEKLCYM